MEGTHWALQAEVRLGQQMKEMRRILQVEVRSP